LAIFGSCYVSLQNIQSKTRHHTKDNATLWQLITNSEHF